MSVRMSAQRVQVQVYCTVSARLYEQHRCALLCAAREKGEEHERYEQLKQAAVSASFTARLAQLVLGASIGPEDLADRANTQLTGLLMLIFIGLLFVKQYIFKPIQACHALTPPCASPSFNPEYA